MFFRARSIFLPGLPLPEEVEAYALYQSLAWVLNLQLHNVIFKTDCKRICLVGLESQARFSYTPIKL